jgi:predicted amidohydrolase
MVESVGFFHYGRPDRQRPLEDLKTALLEVDRKRLMHSVLVLPEAFNLLKAYEPTPEQSPIPSLDLKGHLRTFAAEFGLAFVVGLIEPSPAQCTLGLNVAYLISENTCAVLSQKTGSDDMASVAYTPSMETNDSPVLFEGVSIAALVCMDAAEQPSLQVDNRERHALLRKKITALGAECKLLCVPANTRYLPTQALAAPWPNAHFILANGCFLPEAKEHAAGYHPSVIRIRGTNPEPFQQQTNQVVVRSLDKANRTKPR